MALQIADILVRDRVICRPRVNSKKRALEWLSSVLASREDGVSQLEVFESLFERERLGSTGLGHHVAIPHGRINNIEQPLGAFLQLKQGVDYDSMDGRPVNLIFALLVPEEAVSDHLSLLGKLAEMFNDETLCARLRNATSEDEVYSVLTKWRPLAVDQAAGG